jgi:hypothetical protein
MALVARHYQHMFLDVFSALRSLVGDASNTFGIFSPWMKDGVHGFYLPNGRCLYCDAVAVMLAHAMISGASAAVSRKRQPLFMPCYLHR